MTKKALICGLNYPNHAFALSGCVTDCLDWDDVLRTKYHFDETRVLVDQHPDGSLPTAPTQIPTRNNMLSQLGWLCTATKPGDTLVFIFAGHGCQVRTAQGQIEHALVPEDWSEAPDAPLVYEDELHALFRKLPPGSFLTLVMDCCHASNMLDVPCFVDTRERPPRTLTACERPEEVPRTGGSWEKAQIPHAQARARFVPSAVQPAPRQRRTHPGEGAHVNRMTLNPAVTAFCFAACRTAETAMDANIKKHPRGVMSFCLLEALQELKYSSTYETLLNKAVAIIEDIRSKYMPTMDQHIVLTFCPNSAPSQVVVFNEQYATVAQHRLVQQAAASGRPDSPQLTQDGMRQPVRESSTDFVPSPDYGVPGARGEAQLLSRLFLVVHAAYHLGSVTSVPCDVFVVPRVGRQEHRTSTLGGSLDPHWERDNQFTWPITADDRYLELQVRNASNNGDLLGRTTVDLQNLPTAHWDRQQMRLQDYRGNYVGEAELCFDVRLEPQQPRSAPSPERQAPQQQQQQPQLQPQQQQQQRPPAWEQPPPRELPPQQPPREVDVPVQVQPQPQPQQPPPMGNNGQWPNSPMPCGPGGGGFDGQARPGPPSPKQLDMRGVPEPVQCQPFGGCSPLGSRPGGAADFSGALPPGQPDLFGTPNLLEKMPNLLSNVFGAAASTAASTAAYGSLGLPAASAAAPMGTGAAAAGRSAMASAGFPAMQPSLQPPSQVAVPDGVYTTGQPVAVDWGKACAYEGMYAAGAPSAYDMSTMQYAASHAPLGASYSTAAGVVAAPAVSYAVADASYAVANGAASAVNGIYTSGFNAAAPVVTTSYSTAPSVYASAQPAAVGTTGYSPYPQGRRLY